MPAPQAPAPTKYITFGDFEGMDSREGRVALDKRLLAWLENLQPIGKNFLLSVPGALPAIATVAAESTQKIFYAFVNGVDYAIFCSVAGAMKAINLANGAITNIAPDGTFSNPDVAQWKSERIVIADPTFGYGTWDASFLAGPGTVSPRVLVTVGGSGYGAPPSVTFSGGGASVQATGHSVISGGVVVQVVVDTGGVGYTSAPTITFGSGAAAATAFLFPVFSSVPNMTTLAVFQGRVWIGGNRILAWTGTGGYDDGLSADASGSTTISDSDLVHRITAIRALNNYLYIFGDNSIKQIGSVSVVSSSTVFTLVTLSSDQGTTFPLSIQSYNRLILFANQVGVFAIFGASVEKVSDNMDGIFRAGLFTQPLVACVTDLRNIHTYLLLIKIVDPYTGITRSVIAALMGKKWFLINQGNNLVSIFSAVLNGLLTPYGSSTSDITPILQNAATQVSYVLRTALDADKAPQMNKRALRIMIGQNASQVLTTSVLIESENDAGPLQITSFNSIAWLNNAGATVAWTNGGGATVAWVTQGNSFTPANANTPQAGATGIYLGMTLSGAAQSVAILSMVIEYQEGVVMRSFNTA